MPLLRVTLAAACVLVLPAIVAPAQDLAPLTPIEIAVACSPPPSLDAPPSTALRVMAAQDTQPRQLAGDRDLLIINGGTQAGVLLGQQFYIRRPSRYGTSSTLLPLGVRTIGWIRIVALNETTAIAAVEHACGAIMDRDYLAPFTPPVVPAGADRDEPSGEPDFTALAHVLFGNEDRQTAGAGEFVLIDRGAAQGITPGTRLAVYRDVRVAGMPLASVGEAVVISVGPVISLTRITRARDAVMSGDYVAVRK